MILNKIYADQADPSRFVVPTNCDGHTVQAKVFFAVNKKGDLVYFGKTAISQKLFPDQTDRPSPFPFPDGVYSEGSGREHEEGQWQEVPPRQLQGGARVEMVKVYPKGYDPVIADGSPNDFHRNCLNLKWSPEDTKRMLQMENETVLMERAPVGQWYIVDDRCSPFQGIFQMWLENWKMISSVLEDAIRDIKVLVEEDTDNEGIYSLAVKKKIETTLTAMRSLLVDVENEEEDRDDEDNDDEDDGDWHAPDLILPRMICEIHHPGFTRCSGCANNFQKSVVINDNMGCGQRSDSSNRD
jgi:hypothetical protein